MDYIPNKISMGQGAEILFLLILPFFLKRYGVKKVFIMGMSAWLLRYIFFAYGDVDSFAWMIYIGILLHGICYDFFFVTGQIYVDNEAPTYLKSSAQGMITFATYGLGMLIGTWFAGRTVDFYTADGIRNWTDIWIVPAIIAAVVLALFIFIFKEKPGQKTS
jgi:MFS family permease